MLLWRCKKRTLAESKHIQTYMKPNALWKRTHIGMCLAYTHAQQSSLRLAYAMYMYGWLHDQHKTRLW